MTNRSLIAKPGLLRLLLALAVVSNHATELQIGRGAVMLFFMLSGYWVADLWEKTPEAQRLPMFFLNRILRIWPLYLAVMLACAALFRRLPDLSEWTLFGVASRPFPRLIGTEWSLDIEVQFYALLPLLVLAQARLSRSLFWALVAVSAVIGWQIELAGVVTVFKFLPVFVIGMTMQRTRWKPGAKLAHVSLALFLALFVVQIYVSQADRWFLYHLYHALPHDLLSSLWVVVLAPYVGASLNRRSDPADRTLGDLSYPLYLVHQPLMYGLLEMFDWHRFPGMVVMVLIIALSTFSLWRAVDRPAERLRKRILASRPFDRRYISPAT